MTFVTVENEESARNYISANIVRAIKYDEGVVVEKVCKLLCEYCREGIHQPVKNGMVWQHGKTVHQCRASEVRNLMVARLRGEDDMTMTLKDQADLLIQAKCPHFRGCKKAECNQCVLEALREIQKETVQRVLTLLGDKVDALERAKISHTVEEPESVSLTQGATAGGR